jgi:cobalamin biosynthesis protein CobT
MCCHSVWEVWEAVDCVALLTMEDMGDEGSRESSEDAATEDTRETDDSKGVGEDGDRETTDDYENENVRVDEDTAEADEVGDMADVHKANDIKYHDEDDESNKFDTRFKSLFSQAAAQLAKSIKLRKFEEKFSKSLLIRSAAQESMGKLLALFSQV